MNRPKPTSAKSQSTCSPAESPSTLDEIVDAYIREHREDAERLLRFYRDQPDQRAAIENAALARLPSGKRHPHQYRIPAAKLKLSYERLLDAGLERSTSFETLHSKIEARIGDIHGIGELTIYDTATRVGAFLGLEPRRVFLHRGTREGARSLGLDHRATSLAVSQLPTAFRRLRPHEIEDCLCIYKRSLAGAQSADLRRGPQSCTTAS